MKRSLLDDLRAKAFTSLGVVPRLKKASDRQTFRLRARGTAGTG